MKKKKKKRVKTHALRLHIRVKGDLVGPVDERPGALRHLWKGNNDSWLSG